jgi:hypothetical protein
MAEQEDAFGGDLFKDWLHGLEPGAGRVGSVVGQLRYRAGGDARDWSTPGSTKYLPGDWNMQTGCFRKMFTARNSGGFEFNFPVAFAEPPLLISSIAGTLPSFEESVMQTTVQSKSTVEVYWWSTNNLTRIWVNWLALGPIGL